MAKPLEQITAEAEPGSLIGLLTDTGKILDYKLAIQDAMQAFVNSYGDKYLAPLIFRALWNKGSTPEERRFYRGLATAEGNENFSDFVNSALRGKIDSETDMRLESIFQNPLDEAVRNYSDAGDFTPAGRHKAEAKIREEIFLPFRKDVKTLPPWIITELEHYAERYKRHQERLEQEKSTLGYGATSASGTKPAGSTPKP